MKKHHVDILISEADVRSRINELGAEITHFYQQQAIDKLIVVGLLRGSFMFMADLVRELKLPVEVEFMTTSSYGAGMTSNHDVKITKDLELSLIHISEPTRLGMISYAVFCLKKKKIMYVNRMSAG